ncbi:unnamed protein product, partial [Sphagnum jensenii]
RKRRKMKFDKQNDEWWRRHGYKHVNDDNDIPIIEAKTSDVVDAKGEEKRLLQDVLKHGYIKEFP